MREKVWHINTKTGKLSSAYELQPYAKAIVSAQAFSVSLKSIMVAQDLDGWPRGNNDLLLLTMSSLGEAPRVQRVHYYADEIKPGTVLKNFYGETMHICEDYSGTDRLWLEMRVVEVDTDTGERKALTNAFLRLAATAGSVFPAAMPYAALASGVTTATDKLLAALEKNDSAIECPIALYPFDRPDAGMPLQTGTYVVFGNEVDAAEFHFQPNFTLERADDQAVAVAYAIFSIEAVKTVSHNYALSQKVATLLTQLDKGNNNSATGTIEFLTETLTQYSNFKDLKRYASLKGKDQTQVTEEERQLMDQISKRGELKPFLPK